MNVREVLMNEQNTYIKFIYDKKISIGTVVRIVVDNKKHYFEITSIQSSISNNKNMNITASEIGYYGDCFANNYEINLNDLINISIEIVNDKEEIKKIQEQSQWC